MANVMMYLVVIFVALTHTFVTKKNVSKNSERDCPCEFLTELRRVRKSIGLVYCQRQQLAIVSSGIK